MSLHDDVVFLVDRAVDAWFAAPEPDEPDEARVATAIVVATPDTLYRFTPALGDSLTEASFFMSLFAGGIAGLRDDVESFILVSEAIVTTAVIPVTEPDPQIDYEAIAATLQTGGVESWPVLMAVGYSFPDHGESVRMACRRLHVRDDGTRYFACPTDWGMDDTTNDHNPEHSGGRVHQMMMHAMMCANTARSAAATIRQIGLTPLTPDQFVIDFADGCGFAQVVSR